MHDGQPGWGPDFNPGMPVVSFVDAAMAGLATKTATVAVGPAEALYAEFEAEKERRVGPQWEAIRKAFGEAQNFD